MCVYIEMRGIDLSWRHRICPEIAQVRLWVLQAHRRSDRLRFMITERLDHTCSLRDVFTFQLQLSSSVTASINLRVSLHLRKMISMIILPAGYGAWACNHQRCSEGRGRRITARLIEGSVSCLGTCSVHQQKREEAMAERVARGFLQPEQG